MTYTDLMINKFEEINEHYDGTVNNMHFFSYLTEISSNEVFPFQQAMKQDDRLDFVAAMEKEIDDHESRGHWHIVHRSTLPDNAKPIKRLSGVLNKIKFRRFSAKAQHKIVHSMWNANMEG